MSGGSRAPEQIVGRARALHLFVARAYRIERDETADGHDLVDRWKAMWREAEPWCAQHLSPSEAQLLKSPAGSWDPAARMNASWRVEALAVLAWSVGGFELGPFDGQIVLSDLELPFLREQRSPKLRAPSELEHEHAVTDLVRRMMEGWRKGSLAESDVAEIEALTGGPFEPFGRDIMELDTHELEGLFSISYERLWALRWLRDPDADWDRVSVKPSKRPRRRKTSRPPRIADPFERIFRALTSLRSLELGRNIVERGIEQAVRSDVSTIPTIAPTDLRAIASAALAASEAERDADGALASIASRPPGAAKAVLRRWMRLARYDHAIAGLRARSDADLVFPIDELERWGEPRLAESAALLEAAGRSHPLRYRAYLRAGDEQQIRDAWQHEDARRDLVLALIAEGRLEDAMARAPQIALDDDIVRPLVIAALRSGLDDLADRCLERTPLSAMGRKHMEERRAAIVFLRSCTHDGKLDVERCAPDASRTLCWELHDTSRFYELAALLVRRGPQPDDPVLGFVLAELCDREDFDRAIELAQLAPQKIDRVAFLAASVERLDIVERLASLCDRKLARGLEPLIAAARGGPFRDDATAPEEDAFWTLTALEHAHGRSPAIRRDTWTFQGREPYQR